MGRGCYTGPYENNWKRQRKSEIGWMKCEIFEVEIDLEKSSEKS
jgi:hypothetical protein